jgi:YegS/Rv2252/BmrU family lipid kinase
MAVLASDTPKGLTYRTLPALLIFNPVAGRPNESPLQLSTLLNQLQAWRIRPEVVMVEPALHLDEVARDAVRRGLRLIIVSGGDGTVSAAAKGLIRTSATLGIIPTGTRNNIARSLNIPTNELAGAVAMLRQGRHLRIDVGQIQCGQVTTSFLEVSTVGLAAALYAAAEEIRDGRLTRIGDFLSTLVAHPPSQIHLKLDHGRQNFATAAHVVVVVNMPYTSLGLQLAPDISYDDDYLDLLVYSHLSKLDLIGHMVQLTTGPAMDPRVAHFRVRNVTIETDPPMQVVADGEPLGESPVTIKTLRRALSVMVGAAPPPEASPAVEGVVDAPRPETA